MAFLVRKNERREIRRATPMACQIVRERDFRLVADTAVDISPDGMFVASDIDVDPSDRFIVSFQATELGLWFDTEAEVARVVRGRRTHDRGRGIALRFSTLSRVRRFILRGHLRRIPPPLPARTQRIDWSATVRGIER
jgi:hypothetical protein